MRGQRHAPAALYPGKDLVPIVQEAVWAPGPVWTGAENLAPTGIRSPNRPARSQSICRLRYPAHKSQRDSIKIRRYPDTNIAATLTARDAGITYNYTLCRLQSNVFR